MPIRKKRRSAPDITSMRLNASQRAELYIKEAIYRGVLTAKERIVENELARKIGCSRAPVREAVLRMVREGLLVTMPRRGIFVREFSPEGVAEIFEIRAKLEGVCVRKMRAHLTRKDRELLLGLLKEMESAAAVQDEEAFFEADIKLHRAVWHLSRGKELFRTLNSLLIPFVLAMLRSRSPRVMLDDAFRHHQEYVDLILNGPVETIESDVEQYFMGIYNRRYNPETKPVAAPTGTATWLLESLSE